MDVFLVMRGIKTLAIRMERHCDNAEKIAQFLVNHPKIKKVNYPGLPNHPNHEIAKNQMKRLVEGKSVNIKYIDWIDVQFNIVDISWSQGH